MTVNEIKQTYTMREVAARYGLHPNKRGFIHCPFHEGDKGASLLLYEKDFHCFGCGAHGDMIDFVQKIEQCDFKTAYALLGGTKQPSAPSRKMMREAERKRKRAEAARAERKRRREENRQQIEICLLEIKTYLPFSDDWCRAQKELQRQRLIEAELLEVEYVE